MVGLEGLNVVKVCNLTPLVLLVEVTVITSGLAEVAVLGTMVINVVERVVKVVEATEVAIFLDFLPDMVGLDHWGNGVVVVDTVFVLAKVKAAVTVEVDEDCVVARPVDV